MVEFRILGPFEVVEHDQPRVLGGPKQRAVLVALLLHRGEAVSIDRLIDQLWGERAPATAGKTVQVYISNLRKALGDGVLVTRGHAYLLQIAPGQLDLDRFEALVAEGREALGEGDAEAASDRLREALALWRGPPLADFAYEPFAQGEAARLEEERLAALEDRIDADLALGRHAALVGELEALVREHPLRERLRALLMLALYRSGRQAEALAVYRDASKTLINELGIEPGRALQELEQAILNQDPELAAPARRLPRRLTSRGRAVLVMLGGLVLALAAVAAVLLGGAAHSGRVLAGVNQVGMIDPRTGTVLASVSVAGAPSRLASDGRELWVGGDTSQTLQRIDPGSPPTVVPVNGFPSGLAIGAGSLWMVDALRGVLVKVNRAYGTADPPTPLPGAAREVAIPDRAAFDPWSVAAGARDVWVSDGSSRLFRIDAHTARVTRSPDLGTPIDGVATAGNALWAISGPAATVLRLDPSKGSVTQRIAIARRGLQSPFPVAIALGAGFVWVLSANSGTVTKVDPDLGGVVARISIGIDRGPLRLAAGAGAAWVANGDGTLWRIDAINDAAAIFPIARALTDVATADGRVWVTAGTGPGGGARIGASVSVPAATSVQPLPAASCAPVLSQPDQRPRYVIASDLPLQGTNRTQTLEMTDAIRFVLRRARFRAGRFALAYQACDSSLVAPRGPPNEGARCAPNARAFARDPSVIAVIGPFFSDCTAIEIPIANRAAGGPLAMIAPGATAVGLTHAGPGAGPGEPARYYPTGRRNFARVIPADDVQGAADAMLAQALGADRLFVFDDGTLYGSGVAASFRNAAVRLGLRVVGTGHWSLNQPNYSSLVGSVRRTGATGVFLGGYAEDGGVTLLKALRARLPARVKMLAPDGFNGLGLASEAGSSAEGLTMSIPGAPIATLPPAGRRFLSEFRSSLIAPAQTYTVYAAQATQLMLNAIARSNGTRASVSHALLTARVRNGILGDFAITPNGDTTADAITIYQVRSGTPHLLKVIVPPPALTAPSR